MVYLKMLTTTESKIMLKNCQANCFCEDCIKKHRLSGCHFGAPLYYCEDYEDTCECED